MIAKSFATISDNFPQRRYPRQAEAISVALALIRLLSPVLQSEAISYTITESYIQERFSHFFPPLFFQNAYTVTANEAIY